MLRRYGYYGMTGLIPRGDRTAVAPAASDSNSSSAAKSPRSKQSASVIDYVKAAASVTITPLQILQMIFGSYAIFHTHAVCPAKDGPAFAVFGGVMYLSYLLLFLQMFWGKILKFHAIFLRMFTKGTKSE
jgi:hypothetical protein